MPLYLWFNEVLEDFQHASNMFYFCRMSADHMLKLKAEAACLFQHPKSWANVAG